MFLALTLGLAEVFNIIGKVSRIKILLKCISIMIKFRSIIINTGTSEYDKLSYDVGFERIDVDL